MNSLLRALLPELKRKLKKGMMPTYEKPMLCTLTNNYFSDKNWIYERKLDGARALLFKDKDKIFLKSRNNKNRSDTYPEFIEAAKNFSADQVILDSEIVAFDGSVTSFEKLQPRIGVGSASQALIKQVKIYMYVFDILYLDGYDLTKLPLIKRKSILKKVIRFKDPLRYVTHRNTEGLTLFKEACKKNWEGLIAKKRDSTYVHERSKNWLKFKCIQEQELVVGGYTEPKGSRVGFGALLLGYFEKSGKFHYCGKVGTGFSDDFLQSYLKKLKKLVTKQNPFANKSEVDVKDVRFVRPALVVEIGFEEWTNDNKLRQPRFIGVRDDKNAKDVTKETPQPIVPKR